MNFATRRISVVAFACALAAVDQAAGQHLDIFLARPATGFRTIIGGSDVDSLSFDDTTRVFESETSGLSGEFVALEPGVDHPNVNNPGLTAYPASAAELESGDVLRLLERGFSVGGPVDDLFYWDGTGSVVFSPAAADFRIDAGDPLEETVGVGGSFHFHPPLVIDDDSLPGIYLASVRGVVDGFLPSLPIYLVFGTEELITAEFLGISQEEFDELSNEERDEALEEVIEQGVEFVETNLIIPEPASLVFAAIAICGSLLTYRSRQPGREIN